MNANWLQSYSLCTDNFRFKAMSRREPEVANYIQLVFPVLVSYGQAIE